MLKYGLRNGTMRVKHSKSRVLWYVVDKDEKIIFVGASREQAMVYLHSRKENNET